MINEYIDILHIFVGWCGRYIEVYNTIQRKHICICGMMWYTTKYMALYIYIIIYIEV